MKSVKSIVILVNDQQAAFDFYTQKLGFEVHTDATFGEDNRWLTVNLAGQPELEISLALARTDDAKARVGKQSDDQSPLIGFTTDDIEADISDFRANGVKLASELMDEPWGRFVFFEDLYGNRMYLHQEK
jgi:predicted enzyme related to lactoylglutathione lyase